MSLLFSVIAALLVLGALLFVLPPLLRDPARRQLRLLRQARDAGVLEESDYQRRAQDLIEPGQNQSRGGLGGILGVLIIGCTIALYLQLGTLAGIAPEPASTGSGAEGTAPHSIEEAVTELRRRIEADPSDLQSRMMLGRALKSMNRFAEATEVLRQAQALAPESAPIKTELAEALILDNRGESPPPRAAELLQPAVQVQPQNQKALWLLGATAMQAGRPERAVAHWQNLLPLIEDDSVRTSVQQQIDNARAQLDGNSATTSPPPGTGQPSPRDSQPAAKATAETAPPAADTTAQGEDGEGLEFTVDMAPELRDSVPDQAILFVFARPADGSRMPLAAQRLSSFEFPIRIQLDDTDSMIAGRKLSDHRRVELVARLSASGGASARPGDLEGSSGPIDRNTGDTPRVVIDRVIGQASE